MLFTAVQIKKNKSLIIIIGKKTQLICLSASQLQLNACILRGHTGVFFRIQQNAFAVIVRNYKTQ